MSCETIERPRRPLKRPRGMAQPSERLDMQNLRAQCGCGRSLLPNPTSSHAALRCECGIRITVDFAPTGCMSPVPGKSRPITQWFICGQPTTAKIHGYPVCAEHHKIEVERFEFVPTPPRPDVYEVRVRLADQDYIATNRKRTNQDQVYFIRFRDVVKIGYSRDPESRLRSLTLGDDARIVYTRPGGRTEESRLHKRFAHLGTGGEWFRWDDEIAMWIIDDNEDAQ